MKKIPSEASSSLVENCRQCHDICLAAARLSLEHGTPYTGDDHIGLLIDCAGACMEASIRLDGKTDHYVHKCKVAAELCRLCAESCEQLPAPSPLQGCAAACRSLAASLHDYIQQNSLN